jgi:hypothetical protein
MNMEAMMHKIKPMKIVSQFKFRELPPDVKVMGDEYEHTGQEIEALENRIKELKVSQVQLAKKLRLEHYFDIPKCEYIEGGYWDGQKVIYRRCKNHAIRIIKIDTHRPQCVCDEHYEIAKELAACNEYNVKQQERMK